MCIQRIALDKPLPKVYAEEMKKRIFFASADILDFELVVQDDLIREVAVTTHPGVDEAELAAKVNFLITTDVASQKILPPQVVWQRGGEREYEADVFEAMVERGMVFEAAEGQVALGETLIGLMDTFDARLRDIAVSRLGAQEYRYPTLIPTSVLEECGNFESFPQILMFVTRLHNDVDTYRAFAAELGARDGGVLPALAHCQNVDYCLPPTMCYHTYHQLRDRQFERDLVITSKGKSFRFESKYYRTLERLWDFTIREIVFLGSKDFVLDCRQTFMEAAFAFIEELDLVGHCEVASDPFFCSPDTAAKILNQRMLELKYELRLNIGAERTVAVGSFNFHDQFFGDRFNLRKDDGERAKTGCVGFGLERLVFAFMCQHGLDEKDWPPVSVGPETL
jgi:seryl-tRNA synthetase